VPGYLIESTLKKIQPYLSPRQMVGSVVCSNGFFWIARSVVGKNISLFGFQRVPFICRVREYGKSVDIKGYKSQLKIGGLNNPYLNGLASFFTKIFQTPTSVLNHFLEATLTNSNPILHPARIYAMLSAQTEETFDKEFLFYEEWDDKSSEILIACDDELHAIIQKLPVNPKEIPPLLTYYESTDAATLTQKIRSIAAFKGIKMSMKPVKNGFVIDYSNRYFTEDIPFGLLIIKSLGVLTDTATPTIDNILCWIQTQMGKEYLSNGEMTGMDIVHSGIIQNYRVHSEELFKKG
ncbi:MAG: NAD/NADP octopine/nopaline dehydrogenase family protein, partial [Massilibacteroides sp.]|nr:NAD/NADP octopine/nopaline dehydrogenase family protein [Massilibacteroides sp.]